MVGNAEDEPSADDFMAARNLLVAPEEGRDPRGDEEFQARTAGGD